MTRTNRSIAAMLLALWALAPPVVPAQESQGQVRFAKAPPFDARTDTAAAIKSASARALRDNQRVLLLLGTTTCQRCREVGEFLRDDPQVRRALRDDYRLLAIDLAAPGALAAMDDARGHHVAGSVPYAAVYTPDGKLVAGQLTGPWFRDGRVDRDAILAFLARWAPPDVTAASRVDAGLSRVAKDGRRVFLAFGGAGRDLSYRMDDFLARDDVATRLAKDYDVVKVDVERFVGGQALLQKYRKGPRPTIPWCVILDANGVALADSEGPSGNIGFPVTGPEVAHFLSMLKQTARALTEDDLRVIEAALKDEAANIEVNRRVRARNAAAVRPAEQ